MVKSIEEVHELGETILLEMKKRIIGNERILELILETLLARGHVLLEGVPGIAKSYMAATLGEVLGMDHKRIQFTPDLMPADITGSSIYSPKDQEFTFIPGPVFTNILLCDEISRAPPKTQAALLEAMQEKQVSVEGKSYPLPDPFFVIATQNPIEQVGVYPLPEAQLDRFMVKLLVSLPTFAEELTLLKSKRKEFVPKVDSVTSTKEILQIQDLIEKVEISDQVLEYIASLVVRTRFIDALALGGSPRASLALMAMSRARAALHGRAYVEPDDIKFLFFHVMNHRLILTPQAEVEQIPVTQIIESILRESEVVV